MKRSSEFVDLLMPWVGLLTALAALAFAHQFGSDGIFDDCLGTSPGPLIIVSLVAIAATVIGGLASWGVYRAETETPARKVLAVISAGCALLFCLAMILPVIAAMVIPPCFE